MLCLVDRGAVQRLPFSTFVGLQVQRTRTLDRLKCKGEDAKFKKKARGVCAIGNGPCAHRCYRLSPLNAPHCCLLYEFTF